MQKLITSWMYVFLCAAAFLAQSLQMISFGVEGVSPYYLGIFFILNWMNVGVAWQSRPAEQKWTWVLITNGVNATGHSMATFVFCVMYIRTISGS